MPFIYDLKYLALPNIKFVDRASYKLLTGQDAPAPNLDEDRKNWLDADALADVMGFGRRITYLNVLALDAQGKTRMIDATNEPDPTRRAFYKQYNIGLVPTLEPLQLLTSQAIAVNLGLETGVGGTTPLGIWGNGPLVPYPVRPLDPTEAWYPSPFDPLQVVVMSEYQKQVGPGPSTVNDKLDLLLADTAAIKAKLGI